MVGEHQWHTIAQMDDFHTLWERVSMMNTDYSQLLTDRDYLLRVGEMYHEALRE
jgi:hypothetical protein